MSENKPHLFISHATKRKDCNKKTKKIIQVLYRLLKAENKWDIFIDEYNLKAGYKWRPQILHNLSIANAGLILFDEIAAKNSEWVQAEAVLMSFRQSISRFKLVPILLDGLQEKDECFNLYRPFKLDEITFHKCCIDMEATQIAKEIKGLINQYLKDIETGSGLAVSAWGRKFEEHLKDDLKPSSKERVFDDLFNFLTAGNEVIIENRVVPFQCESFFEKDKPVRTNVIIQLLEHSQSSKNLKVFNMLQDCLPIEARRAVNKSLKAKCTENEWVSTFFNLNNEIHNKLLGISIPEKCPNDLEIFECFYDRLRIERQESYHGFVSITISQNLEPSEISNVLRIEYQIVKNLEEKNKSEPSDLDLEKFLEKYKHYQSFINDCIDDPDQFYICYIPPQLANEAEISELKMYYPQIYFVIGFNYSKIKNEFTSLNLKVLTPLLTREKGLEITRLRQTMESD